MNKLLLLFLLCQPVFAGEPPCKSEETLNGIPAEYLLKASKKSMLCEPSSKAYKLHSALSLLKRIEFSEGALKKPFNQNILPKDFWTYFSQRTKSISAEKCKESDLIAYVETDDDGESDDHRLHLCDFFFTSDVPLHSRVATLLHEVRHFEGYSHVDCIGEKKDSGGCDRRIEDKGSYAVDVESLTKMAFLAKELNPVAKEMVKDLAVTAAQESFNEKIPEKAFKVFE